MTKDVIYYKSTSPGGDWFYIYIPELGIVIDFAYTVCDVRTIDQSPLRDLLRGGVSYPDDDDDDDNIEKCSIEEIESQIKLISQIRISTTSGDAIAADVDGAIAYWAEHDED